MDCHYRFFPFWPTKISFLELCPSLVSDHRLVHGKLQIVYASSQVLGVADGGKRAPRRARMPMHDLPVTIPLLGHSRAAIRTKIATIDFLFIRFIPFD
jgi:hypothetical protein